MTSSYYGPAWGFVGTHYPGVPRRFAHTVLAVCHLGDGSVLQRAVVRARPLRDVGGRTHYKIGGYDGDPLLRDLGQLDVGDVFRAFVAEHRHLLDRRGRRAQLDAAPLGEQVYHIAWWAQWEPEMAGIERQLEDAVRAAWLAAGLELGEEPAPEAPRPRPDQHPPLTAWLVRQWAPAMLSRVPGMEEAAAALRRGEDPDKIANDVHHYFHDLCNSRHGDWWRDTIRAAHAIVDDDVRPAVQRWVDAVRATADRKDVRVATTAAAEIGITAAQIITIRRNLDGVDSDIPAAARLEAERRAQEAAERDASQDACASQARAQRPADWPYPTWQPEYVRAFNARTLFRDRVRRYLWSARHHTERRVMRESVEAALAAAGQPPANLEARP